LGWTRAQAGLDLWRRALGAATGWGRPGSDAGAHAAQGARLVEAYCTKLKPEQTPSLKVVEVAMDGVAAAKARAEVDAAIAEGVLFARDLVSEHANVLYPESFVQRLRDLETLRAEVDVLTPETMKSWAWAHFSAWRKAARGRRGW
jgi:leucyl aminopeptidase